MKKLIPFLLVICILSFSITAFAAAGDTNLTFSLDANRAHTVQAEKGDVIEVTYSISADKIANTSTNQNEIQYNHTFFRLVPNSLQLTETGSDYTTATPVASDGSRRIFFNTASSRAFKANTPQVIGSFKLEVIASEGSSTVQSTNCFAQDKDGNRFGSKQSDLTVTVKGIPASVPVTGVTLNKSAVTLKKGDVETLTATIAPADATNKNVVWFSSNIVAATVDDSGKVTAKASGTAIITATTADGGKTATCTVTVPRDEIVTPGGGQAAIGGDQAITVPQTTTPTLQGGAANSAFTDVQSGSYYYDAVLWAAKKNITTGTDATHFSPNAAVTRAQVVTFLWRAAGSPTPTVASRFTDVKAGGYYEKAVAWAVSKGITKGTGETTFGPDAVCTRGQIVTFLARYAGVQDTQTASAFSDVKPTDYFAAAVQWAKDNNVTAGTSATTFSPKQDCTRAQVVTFLYRWMVR